ncbi:DUF1206 domain-containing protein [Rhodoplanes sp. TEM]|uniref:DUF1206 domain-containing protein n=1 Tax=Rhodoplanes tepidamans TaxID=200616 RepID=A0ABT5J8K3_RHOTP|nr:MULTISPECIES: DUF1206 domain-containing protein [Rhodoplanes]MDC7785937.1 DUF1206 domain-containing protein [Rhodoplanes tepidamans]MDC7986251.1 DUF1206 domain-containing protein [Rhodoplanes sp. TEM]MDQ0355444.1 hypothetical protein [Rhodoplanes tepidamans]
MQDQSAERLARLGYAARGVVYLLVGGLAVMAALGRGGETTGSKGALQTLLEQPLGTVWLAIVSAGLLCFAAWRVLQSVFDADHLGRDRKALLRRAGWGVSAVMNAALAFSTLGWALGYAAGGGDGEASARDWTASVLAVPLGQWLLGAVGLGIAAAGIGVAVKAWRSDIDEGLACDDAAARWVVPLGRAGMTARAVVFVLIGVFLVIAAVTADARDARGLAGALRTLQEQPYGWILLAATALGLFAFGLFQFAVARYRHIDAGRAERLSERVGRGARRAVGAAGG